MPENQPRFPLQSSFSSLEVVGGVTSGADGDICNEGEQALCKFTGKKVEHVAIGSSCGVPNSVVNDGDLMHGSADVTDGNVTCTFKKKRCEE